MDQRFNFRKGYDTDLVILRSIFALDPDTNQAISSFYSPVSDGIGGVQWLSIEQYFSAGTGILNFISSVQSFSTVTGLFSNFSTQTRSTLLTDAISTFWMSTGMVETSSINFLNANNGTRVGVYFDQNLLYVNNSQYFTPGTVFQSSLLSTVRGLGTIGYISSSQFLSTIDKLGPKGLGYVDAGLLISTEKGLGTYGYISSSQLLSTSAGIFINLSTISTNAAYKPALFSTSAALTSQIISSSSALTSQIISSASALTPQIISTGEGALAYATGLYDDIKNVVIPNTVANLGSSNYVSTSQLGSTVVGLGTAGYLSSVQLLSTVGGLGSIGYISSSQLLSSITGTSAWITSTTAGITSNRNSAVASTVTGLGTIGYISSAQLQSTVVGLGGTGTVSTGQLISTVAGLGTIGYISSTQLQSTIVGLGGSGLVSTGQLISTTAGVTGFVTSTTAGITGIIDPLNFTSTVRGLGTAGYISSSQLGSTTKGLIDSIVPASGITTANLVSTVGNLGTAGYISTSGLGSTVVGLQNSFTVVNASQVFVNNSRVTISSVGTFIFFSTFMNSSITYQGNNGSIIASNAGVGTAPLYFSSATLNIDRWSSFINAQSIITVEAYPNFFFANLGLTSNPSLIFMSTLIQAGTNFTSSQMFQSAIYPTTYSNNQSNRYAERIKITLPGSVITGFYPQPTRLVHYLPNAVTIGTTQGFSNSNVSMFFGSTNSLFLSVQNLPL